MLRHLQRLNSLATTGVGKVFDGPQVLVMLPAFVLAGFWIGGELVLTLTAIAFPAIFAIYAMLQPISSRMSNPKKRRSVAGRTGFTACVDKTLKSARENARKTVCLIVEPDDLGDFAEMHGQAEALDLVDRIHDRLGDALRGRDVVSRLDDRKLGVIIAPVDHLNLDVVLQLASRLQNAVEKPLQLGGTTLYVSATVGFALDTHFRGNAGPQMVDAAELALTVAQRNGPASIRAYSPDMREAQLTTNPVSSELDTALESGQIVPWFQPQISTDTGKITGFEALARWEHPDRGIVSPGEFLPEIQQAGRMERLGEIILSGALQALKTWDSLGIDAPKVGVNFSSEELSNPRLTEKVEWELDRFGLTPDRLAVEILETVVATSPDSMITRNISALSDLGCQIDLDDFGTGHASISSLRRFSIQRLKIDRSFIMKVDQDPDQQRMVSAILLMAERLDLDTLAEGIETAGEHAMLAQLGCGHVQGFGIGKPKPADEIPAWVSEHLAKLSAPPEFRYKAG